MKFEVPDGPKQYVETLGNFLGVDFTSVSPSKRRSPRMINFTNNNGFLETRMGYDVVGHSFGVEATLETEHIKFTSIRKSKDSNDITISFVNPGVRNSKLQLEVVDKHLKYILETNSYGDVITTAKDIRDVDNYYVKCEILTTEESIVDSFDTINLTGGESHPINGIWNIDSDTDDIFIAHVGTKIYELDANFENPFEFITIDDVNDVLSTGIYLDNRLLIFDGKRALIYGKFGEAWEIKYLDENGYIPTTFIARNPNGLGGSKYEDVNLLQPYRINSFLGNYSDYIYQLDSPFDDGEEPTVRILNNDGSMSELSIDSYNATTGTVTFESAPPTSPVDGRDNIFITFKVTNNENKDFINNCTIVTTFGYEGNNNRVFVTGNSDYPNVDWFSNQDNPLYFPVNNYTRIGFEPIVSYLRLNDGSLAVLKNISDTDASIYYRKSGLYNDKEVFPIEAGVKSVGCISKHANANLLNDPLTLTSSGVFGIVGSDSRERFAMDRSFYIKDKLLQEPNLDTAQGFVFQDKYHIAINGNVYVADGRYISKEQNSSSNFQYEWYFWNNVPVRLWFSYDNELYFCNHDGDIVKFNDDCYDYNIPIYQSFDTSFLDLKSITQAKTAKRVTVISSPVRELDFKLSYLTNEDVEDITSREYQEGEFPRTLQEKEKIKKFMFVKLRISSDKPKKVNFYQIAIEYILAGRYRGE